MGQAEGSRSVPGVWRMQAAEGVSIRLGENYLLSPRDICTLRLIPDLAEAGVSSLKIEGRMKSPEYAAGVTAMYRKYLDLYLEKGREGFAVDGEDELLLAELFSRGLSPMAITEGKTAGR